MMEFNAKQREEEEIEVLHRYTIVYDEDTNMSEVEYVESFEEDETLDMEEIKKQFNFLKENISIGTIKKGDKVKLEYPFEGDPELIEKAKPGCSCTAEVNIDKVGKKVTAVYDSKNDSGSFSKSIIVYFKDGKSLEIKTPTGIKAINPKKAKISLTFSGKIK